MRYIRRGFVVPVLAGLLIFFALPPPPDAHSTIDRDPYGLEKADKIAPGWMEARMKAYLADLWFERGGSSILTEQSSNKIMRQPSNGMKRRHTWIIQKLNLIWELPITAGKAQNPTFIWRLNGSQVPPT